MMMMTVAHTHTLRHNSTDANIHQINQRRHDVSFISQKCAVYFVEIRLRAFAGLFTDTSDHIRFFTF